MSEQLEFDIVLKTLGIDTGISSVEKAIERMSKSTEKLTLQMYNRFEELFKGIESKKTVITSIEQQLASLEKTMIATPESSAKATMFYGLEKAKTTLSEAKKGLSEMEAEAQKSLLVFEKMIDRYNENVVYLEKMREKGLETTTEFNTLSTATEKLKQSIDNLGANPFSALNTSVVSNTNEAISETKSTVESTTQALKEQTSIEKSNVSTLKEKLRIIKETENEIKKLKQEQTEIVKGMESETKADKKTYQAMVPGTQKVEKGIEIKDNESLLLREKDHLEEIKSNYAIAVQQRKELEEQIKTSSRNEQEANNSVATTIRQLRDEMQKLRSAGGDDSDEYQAMEEKVSELEKARKEVNETIKVTSNKTEIFQGVMSGITGITGALSAGMGVMSLFGLENEKLSNIQQKLQAVMAITIGLQSVANTLNQTSAFSIAIVRRATQAWAVAQTFLTAQLGLSTIAARAFIATGIGAIVALIGVAVWGLYKAFSSANDEGEKLNKTVDAMSEVSQKANENASREITRLEMLRKIYTDSTKSMKDRKMALDEFNASVPNYHASLSAEGTLINDNTNALDAYRQKLIEVEKTKLLASKIADNWVKTIPEDKKLQDIQAKLAPYEKKIAEYKSNANDNWYKKRYPGYSENDFIESFKKDDKGFNTVEYDFLKAKEKAQKEVIAKMSAGDKIYQEALEKLDTSTVLRAITNPKNTNVTVVGKTTEQKIEDVKKSYQELERLKGMMYPWNISIIKNDLGGENFTDYLQNQIKKGGKDVVYFKIALKEATSEDIEKARKIYQDLENNKNIYSTEKKQSIYEKMGGATTYEDFLKNGAINQKGVASEEYNNAYDAYQIEQAENGIRHLIELKEKYISYSQKRDKKATFFDSDIEDLETAKEDRENALRNQGMSEEKIQADEEIKALIENIKIATQQKENSLNELDLAFAKDNEDVKKYLQSIAKYTSEDLNKELGTLQAKLTTALNNENDSETIQILRSKIAELNKIIKDLNAGGKTSTTEDTLKSKDEEKRVVSTSQLKAMRSAKTLARELQAIFAECDDGISDTLEVVGVLADGAIDAAGAVADFAIATTKGIEGMSETTAMAVKSAETASVVLAVISATLQVATAIMNIFNGRQKQREEQLKQERKYQRELLSGEIEYNKLVSDRLYNEKQITAEKVKQARQNQAQAALDAQNLAYKIQAEATALERKLASTDYSENATRDIQARINGFKKLAALLRSGDLDAVKSAVFAVQNDKDVWNEYKSMAESVLEQFENWRETLQEIKDEMTGTAGDYISSFVEALKNGEDATYDFANAFKEKMRDAIIQGLSEQMLYTQINRLLTRVQDEILGDNGVGFDGISQTMVDSWVTEAEKIQNDALGVRKTIGEIIKGLGLDDITSSSSTLSASIQGVSEETASLVAGQMNAIRSNQRRHIELLEMINDNISSGKVASSVQVFLPNGDKAETSKMVFQMKDYSPVLDGMTDSLFKLVENTSYNRNLESIAKDIHSMSLRPSGSGTADMSSLRASGIKY